MIAQNIQNVLIFKRRPGITSRPSPIYSTTVGAQRIRFYAVVGFLFLSFNFLPLCNVAEWWEYECDTTQSSIYHEANRFHFGSQHRLRMNFCHHLIGIRWRRPSGILTLNNLMPMARVILIDENCVHECRRYLAVMRKY